MLDQLVPLLPSPGSDNTSAHHYLSRMVLSGLAVLSTYMATKTILRFQTHFQLGQLAAESPTMFLLAWLGGCDILTALSSLLLIWPVGSGGIASTHILAIQRAIVSAQVCYFLLLTLLSIHTLSISGRVNRKFDMITADYYGPASGTLAFLLAHPSVAGLGMFRHIVLVCLPLCTLISLTAAAWQISAAQRSITGTLQMRVEETTTITVSFYPKDYVRFAYAALASFVFFLIPWIVWSHVQTQTPLLTWLAAAALCARGALPFILCQVSPATNMVLQDSITSQN